MADLSKDQKLDSRVKPAGILHVYDYSEFIRKDHSTALRYFPWAA